MFHNDPPEPEPIDDTEPGDAPEAPADEDDCGCD